MKFTTNLNLKKPDYTDQVDIEDINSNMDIIDSAIQSKVDSSRVLTNVPSGAKFTDTITTINGKTGAIAKADITALGIPAQDTVYTHPATAGNKHIPTGGTVGQVLKNTASGTATWENETDTITTINGKTGSISKADIVALGIPSSDTNTTYTAGAGLTLTGTVFTPTFGTTAGTVAQGNDSRFTNARTPTSHSHAIGDLPAYPTSLPANGGTASTLTGLTSTIAELNFVNGVTSNIQTQLNGKATSAQGTLATNALPKAGGTITGTLNITGTAKATGRFYAGTVAPTLTTRLNYDGYFYATKIYGAVYNDYAEYRQSKSTIKCGRVVTENGEGYVTPTTKRLSKIPMVVSDTYGFSIGEQSIEGEISNPIAVAGRVLVYTDKDVSTFKVGDVVCAGKGGVASKMKCWEKIIFPDRILGIVSEIPKYKTWGTDDVNVDGRIWIKI